MARGAREFLWAGVIAKIIEVAANGAHCDHEAPRLKLDVGRHELHSDLRDVTENRPNFCGVTSACRSSKKLALSLTFTASRCARLITAVREQM